MASNKFEILFMSVGSCVFRYNYNFEINLVYSQCLNYIFLYHYIQLMYIEIYYNSHCIINHFS